MLAASAGDSATASTRLNDDAHFDCARGACQRGREGAPGLAADVCGGQPCVRGVGWAVAGDAAAFKYAVSLSDQHHQTVGGLFGRRPSGLPPHIQRRRRGPLR